MRRLLTALVLALIVLHQDFWLWKDARLVFGFLPAGLAYHAAYSVAAAGLLALLVRFAWPHDLEAIETPLAGSDKRGGGA
ncbi:MAG: DUF3311 domain-containing protein [Planctomycetes bacterium]|nr:DUF3311 domain-containing protein [Planctomycetota bacterium]